MRKHSAIWVSALVLALFLIVLLRLAQLSLVQAADLAAAAEAQRTRSLDYYQYARGDFYDRSGQPLTSNEQYCAVVFPAMMANSEQAAADLAPILGRAEADIARRLAENNQRQLRPYILSSGLELAQAEALSAAQIEGVYALTLAARYRSGYPALHILGYVQPVGAGGAMAGVSGLEQEYEDMLSGRQDTQVVALVDADGRLSADSLLLAPAEELKRNDVHLTLDADYQQIAESAFAETGYQGACVIMDPNNGDLLAVVSAPGFDPEGWQPPLSDDAYVNKAFALYPPASTFKILLTIAALSEGIPLPDADSGWKAEQDAAAGDAGNAAGGQAADAADAADGAGEQDAGEAAADAADAADAAEANPAGPFVCIGSYTFAEGQSVSCSGNFSHGEIDLPRALAASCNCYFVALGQALGADTIRDYARRLGLAEQSIIGYTLPQLPESDYLSFADLPAGIANASLGELGLRLSAVQEAALVAACVNGGFRVWPRLVSGVYDQNGRALRQFSARSPERVMDTALAEEMRLMLIETVAGGTGQAAQGEHWRAGGKTGTGEQGGVWFSGFAPAEQPQAVIAVYVQNGSYGGVEAAAIFKRIIDQLATLADRV